MITILVLLALLFVILSLLPGTGPVPWLALAVLLLVIVHLLPLLVRLT